MKAFRAAWLTSKAIHPAPPPVKYCPTCKRSLAFEYQDCPYDGATLQFTEHSYPALPQSGAGGGRGGRGGRGGQ
jgi:hypothetical protein